MEDNNLKGNNTTNKKKILHVVEAMGGGIFTYLVNLANSTCDKFDIAIAYGVRDETPDNMAEYFDDRIRLIRVENFARNLNPKKDIAASKEIRNIAKEFQPDIIHMHSSKAGALGRLSFSSKKYDLYYTPHGYSFLMEDFSRTKKFIFFTVEKLCGYKNCLTVACGYGEYEESKKVTKRCIHISNGVNVKEIDMLLASGSDTAENAGGEDSANAGNADTAADVQSKAATGTESRAAAARENNKFTVYTTGRISYQKNPEMFNQVAKLLPEVEFLWIGDGDMREVLDADNIQITGWVERGDALRRADRSDVFFLSSRWEGLPISILEAMYMKKPCVVSNISGNRHVIIDGETGYLCETAEEYAEVIKKLQADMNCEIINCAYEKILSYYNIERLGERYTKLYETGE